MASLFCATNCLVHVTVAFINDHPLEKVQANQVFVHPSCYYPLRQVSGINVGPNHVQILTLLRRSNVQQVVIRLVSVCMHKDTVLPAKSDSDDMCGLKNYQSLRIDKSLVY